MEITSISHHNPAATFDPRVRDELSILSSCDADAHLTLAAFYSKQDMRGESLNQAANAARDVAAGLIDYSNNSRGPRGAKLLGAFICSIRISQHLQSDPTWNPAYSKPDYNQDDGHQQQEYFVRGTNSEKLMQSLQLISPLGPVFLIARAIQADHV